MNANIIFYSNACEGSQILLSLLQNENLIKYFYLICTDNNSKIPSEIKVTPTLFIKGINTPYVAGAAFVWFQQIKQEKIKRMIQQLEANSNSSKNGTDINDSPWLGYNKNEMGGISDTFALMTDDNIPHSHFEYAKIGSEADKIFYVGTKENTEKKLDETHQIKLAKMLELERSKQNDELSNKKRPHTTPVKKN